MRKIIEINRNDETTCRIVSFEWNEYMWKTFSNQCIYWEIIDDLFIQQINFKWANQIIFYSMQNIREIISFVSH